MNVLITGINGFLGRNLAAHLGERQDVEVFSYVRHDPLEALSERVASADFVFHFAGVNRPSDQNEFKTGNADFTRLLCRAVQKSGKRIQVLYASSSQADQDNPYGISKRDAEDMLLGMAEGSDIRVHIFRLPNVFGKWAKPDYNSVVATFCHNIARDLPIQIHDPSVALTMVYVDDVITRFINVMDGKVDDGPYHTVEPQYSVTVGELAELIKGFKHSRSSLVIDTVGAGLVRALYATYMSYLPPEEFAYRVAEYRDPRGVFAEMLKTRESGQFSFFTAHPGVTRGGHYHHSKTEKFLVIKGNACFRFRNIATGDYHELRTSEDVLEIVETVPGWTHDITNIGNEEMIVMLWANEIFDRMHPDTYAMPVVSDL